MKRALPMAVWIMLFSSPLFAQDVVSAWFPTHIGDSWTYQREERDGSNGGGMARPEVWRWQVEETIKGSIVIPEGTLLRKHVQAVGRIPVEVRRRLSSIQDAYDSYDLIRGNCVYNVDQQIDARTAQLRPEYRRDLLSDSVAAEFCFPLKSGSTWGKVSGTSPAGEFVWRVVGVNGDTFGPSVATTFHLTTHAGSGEMVDRWFEPGIGVVQEIREHHGTYEESRLQILSAIVDGQTRTFQLKPARTIPLSDLDCDGPGWQHFVRLNGTGFANQRECAAYVSQKQGGER
jgi:hypothetical protein